MIPLKAEVVKTGHYRVLSIPFYGPIKARPGDKGRDMDLQYFSERTDPKPDWFPQRPVIWHHGLDNYMDDDIRVGMQEPITKAKDGWWGELWLDKQNKYFSQIDAMIQSQRMFGSSGTMGHLIKASPDGELLVWPHVEQTLSPIPRNPYSVVRATKALEDYEDAGLVNQLLLELSTDLQNLTSGTSPGDVAAKAELTRSLDELEDIVRTLGG